MQVAFHCPSCEQSVVTDVPEPAGPLSCRGCGWKRDVAAAAGRQPAGCLVCSCADLWRQKDFPQRLGLLLVACGAVISTIAWYQHRPVAAIATLMLFALADLLLYTFMKDMLVCYRCGARHRRVPLDETHQQFDLEVAERYRQQQLQMEAAKRRPVPTPRN